MKTRNRFTTPRLNILLTVLLLTGWSCKPDAFQKLDERNWQLVWSDEFDGNAGDLPDASKWNFDIGTGQDGWGNQELQSYTNNPANISLNGEGHLVITALRNGNSFTSARINTKGLLEQAYGRFEARIKTPYGPGIWPAFWMLGSNLDTVSWPQAGEIDIMELKGQQPTIMYGSIHGPGYSGGNAISKAYGLTVGRFDTDFRLFAVEWFPDRIDFFVDDFLYQRINKKDVDAEWVFDQPFFILLNVAVGGTFVGFPTSETPFPQTMTVDFVRVYQEAS